MTTEYTLVDTELLAQMMRVAKQNPGTPAEHLEALQKAVEERKKQLGDQLTILDKQPCIDAEALRRNERSQLHLYQQLIALEPDNYLYYKWAGKCAHFAHDYAASAALYTSALQLVGDDVEKLWQLYKERSRAYLYAKDYASSLADGKMFLRFKYLSKEYDNPWRRQKSYNLYMICESLRQLGNQALGDEIDTTYELAKLSEEGVTDELIEEYCALLNIPVDAQSSPPVPQEGRSSAALTRMSSLKQLLSTDPVEIKKRHLCKQIFQEIENKLKPDFPWLIRVSQELVTLEPTNYRYHATVGEMYFRARNHAGAIPPFTNALGLVEQYPGDAYWQTEIRRQHLFDLHRMLAWSSMQERNHQRAIAHYEQAIRAYPQNQDTTRLMALIVHCTYKRHLSRQAGAMEHYFCKAFPKWDVLRCVSLEESWESVFGALSTQFVEFSDLGIELSRHVLIDHQTEAEISRLTTSRERTEEEQQQAQKNAETIKHLEELLRFARMW